MISENELSSTLEGLETETSLLGSIQESCSRCISIMFDLYPVAVVTQIIEADPRDGSGACIASALSNSALDSKIRLRMLKLLLSISKLAPSFSSGRASARVQEFFSDQYLHRMLNQFASSRSNSAPSDINDGIVEVSSKIIQIIQQQFMSS
jgi:hypothetical protein